MRGKIGIVVIMALGCRIAGFLMPDKSHSAELPKFKKKSHTIL